MFFERRDKKLLPRTSGDMALILGELAEMKASGKISAEVFEQACAEVSDRHLASYQELAVKKSAGYASANRLLKKSLAAAL